MFLLRAITITIGLLSVLPMLSCNRDQPGETIGRSPIEFEVIRTNMVTTVTTTGRFRFTRQSELTFGDGGTVLRVPGSWGAKVNFGDIIAQLEDGVLELAVAKAETNWLNAQDSLQEILDGPSKGALEKSEATIKTAEASLFAAMNRATESVSKASDAEVEYQNIFRSWLGMEIPIEALSLPPQQLLANIGVDLTSLFALPGRPFKLPQYSNSAKVIDDDLTTPWDEQVVYAWTTFFPLEIVPTCKGETQQIKAQLGRCVEDEMTTKWGQFNSAVVSKLKDEAESLRLAAELELAKENLAELRKPIDANRVREREQKVHGTYAALVEARTELAQAKILAPFDGVITEINVEVGERVAPRAIAATIVDPSFLEIIVQVDEIDVSKISAGQPVSVNVDAFPKLRMRASVEAIALVGRNQSGVVTYEVHLAILNRTNDTLREGMTVIAEIQVENFEDVLTIPLQAIRAQDGVRGVLVVDGTSPRTEDSFRALELGASNDRVVVVLSGLEEGEKILIPGASNQASEFSGQSDRFPGSGIFGGRNRSRP